MNILKRYLIKVHPIIKILFYLQLFAIAIWGPIISSIMITTICFIILIFYSGEKSIIANPYYALLFCGIAVLIVLPGGSKSEIIYASKLSARILNIMLISAITGLIIKPHDILIIGKCLHLPEKLIWVIIAMALFLPNAIHDIQSVIFAQRSRGFELNIFSFFRLTTYRVLIIPYIVCILRSALSMWISMNLRTRLADKQANTKYSILEILMFLTSFVLWIN